MAVCFAVLNTMYLSVRQSQLFNNYFSDTDRQMEYVPSFSCAHFFHSASYHCYFGRVI